MRAIPEREKARIGIIGTGWVATARHVPAFKRDHRAEVVAVLDRSLDRAQAFAKQFHIPKAFQDLEDFLTEPLHAIAVCTPPQAHAPIVEACLKAGRHVLVEKPMTMTSSEGRYLDELATRKGVILCPAHSFLFSRAMREAESFLQEGQAGQVQWALGIQTSSWRRRLPTWFDELPGGLFFDEAPHLIYLMHHFLGGLKVEQSWRDKSPGNAATTRERIEIRVRGTHGGGQLTMCFGAPLSEWLFILICSDAMLILDLFRDILIRLPAEKAHTTKDVLKSSMTGTLQFWKGIARTGIQRLRGPLFFGHDVLVSRFLDAVVDRAEPPVPAYAGWGVVATIEEAMRLAASLDGP